ncbi:MAG: ABC transporter permease subunit [Rhodobacter sp.]|nr:ABC transporter permease subunit [Rhodobacter sp.]
MRWINRHPGRALALFLTVVPFVLVLLAYALGSEARRAVNPADKLLPAPAQIAETAVRLVTEPDRRSGVILVWQDTAASLRRLALGVGIGAGLGLVFGLVIGLLPLARTGLAGFVAVLSMIPPLAILPILFIVFGLGELSKVALIAIGITPFLIRDLSARTAELPFEQLVKAQTLGASSLAIGLRVALPQIMPRLIQAVRLSLGPAWLFLIAAEAIASQDGLGYRIFLVRRYLAMDVILTYVIWITVIAFTLDWLLARLSRRLYPWAEVR